METSHACIAAYRQRIAALDKIVAERENKNGNSNGKNNSEKGKRSEGGPVELRKLIQRFRQFLAEEEKFWIAFILRFARSFDLNEVQTHIDALQLNRNTEDPSMRKNTFPEEGPPMPPSKSHREKKLAVLMKAFISLGDLARYREQYNERQGRPKAGSEDVLPRWATKSARKPGEVSPRPRNYARSLACYSQACALLPDYGHAFHQLAILSSYQADTFGSILNYYRSICVKNIFAMANENLHKTLGKAYESFRNEPMEPIQDEAPVRAIVDRFKKDVVVLHCLWKADKVRYVGPLHGTEVVY
jgi:protein SMG7